MADQQTDAGTSTRRAGRLPLVDRRRELAELEEALAAARTGNGRISLIAGEPGIGKTRFAEAVADKGTEGGMLTLWGRAWETGGAPSYWPWVQALRTLIRTRDETSLESELGDHARWLVQVLPELAELVPGLRPPRSTGTDSARFALFDAATSFLRNAAANTPLVMVLDDLHAADADSLLLLEFLAHGIAESQIAFLGTYQEAAAARRPEVERLIGSLARASLTLTLRGFDKPDLAQMIEYAVGRPWTEEAVGALHRTTEGNPFFSAEIIRLLGADDRAKTPPEGVEPGRFPLPDTVRETIRRRLAPLDPATVEALKAAAVIGREFRLSTLERVVSEPEGVIERIDEAAEAGLVAELPGSIGRFRFVHNLITETLYSGLGAARRAELHAAVGEALETRYGAPADRLAELAHHFAHTEREAGAQKAVEYARKAGSEAMRLFAYDRAADLYRLALDASERLNPDPERRADLMLAWASATARSDHLAGRDALLTAADAARDLDDPTRFAEAGLAMRAWPRGGGILDDEPSGVLTEALARLPERDSGLRARVAARLAASLYYWAGTEQRRAALVEEAVALARRLGDPYTLAHVLSNGQLGTWGPDRTERDLGWMEEVLLLLGQVGGDDELELVTRNRQIDFFVELGDLPAADAALRALELTVRDSSDPRAEGYVYLQRGRHAVIEGRFQEAERLNAQAVHVGSRLRDTNMMILAANQLAGMRWSQGRLAEVEPQIREVAAADVTVAWQAALVRACCETGCEAEARRALERLAANDFADLPRYNGWLISIALLSEACILLGDVVRAGKLYELLLPFAGRNVTGPHAIFAGPVTRFLGILCAAREDWSTAAAHFEAARSAAARMNAPPVLVRVNLDEARMLTQRDEAGDRARALALIGEARPIAAELGLKPLSAQLEELSAELGAGGPAVPVEPAAPRANDAAFASLRCEGEFWTFEHGRRSVRLRDSKGVRYIAFLLARPGIEVHSMELAGGALQDGSGLHTGRGAEASDLGGPEAGNSGPMLDAQAKQAYRRHLEELREEVEEAESFNDPERAARARVEIDFLERELAGAVGLGGRDRKAASSAERARVSVTKAIRTTIRRIREHDPILARELEATVRTGTFCVHDPDPRHPLEWRLDTGAGRVGT